MLRNQQRSLTERPSPPAKQLRLNFDGSREIKRETTDSGFRSEGSNEGLVAMRALDTRETLGPEIMGPVTEASRPRHP